MVKLVPKIYLGEARESHYNMSKSKGVVWPTMQSNNYLKEVGEGY